MSESFFIRPAVPGDVGDILGMVRELADYEKLLHECVAMEKQFHEALFGDTPPSGGSNRGTGR